MSVSKKDYFSLVEVISCDGKKNSVIEKHQVILDKRFGFLEVATVISYVCLHCRFFYHLCICRVYGVIKMETFFTTALYKAVVNSCNASTFITVLLQKNVSCVAQFC